MIGGGLRLCPWAGRHGIVAISIKERFIGLPKDQLEAELDRFTALLAAGARAVGSAG